MSDFYTTFGFGALVLALEAVALLAVGSYTRSAATMALGMGCTLAFLIVAYLLVAGSADGGAWVVGR